MDFHCEHCTFEKVPWLRTTSYFVLPYLTLTFVLRVQQQIQQQTQGGRQHPFHQQQGAQQQQQQQLSHQMKVGIPSNSQFAW